MRSVILKAHEAFQATVAPSLRNYITFDGRDDCVPSPSKSCSSMQNLGIEEGEVNFVELAALWQAPLYEFSFSKGIDGQSRIFAAYEALKCVRMC